MRMSKSFLPKLQELIACSVERERKNGKILNEVVLKEINEQDGSIVSQVTISNLPDDTFIFKVDAAFPEPDQFFNDIEGVRKRADYILLAQKNDKKRVLFIEMKRTKDSENGIHAQLRGASCVLDYCKAVLLRFLGEETILNGFEERYVSFGGHQHKRLTGRDSATNRNAPLNDSPENMQKLKGHSFTYQQLIRQ